VRENNPKKMDVYDSYSKKLLAEDILPFELEDATVDAKEETAILPSTGVKQIRRIFGGDTGPTNNNNSSSNTGGGSNNNTTTTNNNSSNETTSTNHNNNNSSRSASNRSNRSRPTETSKKQAKEEEPEEAEPELVQNVSEFDAVRF
jgi:hypothetical protein